MARRRKTLKQKKVESPIKPKGRSKYALKKQQQAKGTYIGDSPFF